MARRELHICPQLMVFKVSSGFPQTFFTLITISEEK